MAFKKVKLNKEVTRKLSLLKGRMGVTPNIICRFALCMSLENSTLIGDMKSESDGQEINRYTLNGEFDQLFIMLVKFRCFEDGLDPEKDFNLMYKLHIERGVNLIFNRIKEIKDINNLFDY
jgi:DNA sulfur modification protein DndE